LDFQESTKTLASYSQKTKEELIIRTSNQWFCTISDPVSENFLKVLQNVNFVGSQAKGFIKEMGMVLVKFLSHFLIRGEQKGMVHIK